MSTWDALNDLTPEQRSKVLAECTEISERQMNDSYVEFLNEAYGTVKIAGYDYDTADALQSVDPVAYRCGFADYISENDSVVEWSGSYYETAEVDREIEDLLEEEESDNEEG